MADMIDIKGGRTNRFIGSHRDALLLSFGQSRGSAAMRRTSRRHRFRIEPAPARALRHSLPCDLPVVDLHRHWLPAHSV
jgi:hypothetical protein